MRLRTPSDPGFLGVMPNSRVTLRIIMATIVFLLAFCPCAMPGTVSAGGKAVREVAEELAEQVGKTGSKEFVETTSIQLERIVRKCGIESLDVIEKHGMAAFRVLQNAGEDSGPYLINAFRKYGDDAVRVAQTSAGRGILREGSESAIKAVIRHTDIVIPLIRKYGDDCARVLADLSQKNGRRLLQLADEGLLPASHLNRLMPTIYKYGDEALEFIWRNKGPLATAALLAAFVKNPEPYMNGTKELASVLVSPITETLKNIAKGVNWNLWIGVALMAGGIWIFLKNRIRNLKRKDNRETPT